MLKNLGIHVIRYPTGKYGFVGSVPVSLGTLVKATADDIMAGRSFDQDGSQVTVKFPIFPSAADAWAHAQAVGVDRCAVPGCLCSKER